MGLWLQCCVFLRAVLRPHAEPAVPHKQPPLGGDSGDVRGGDLGNPFPSHLLKIKDRKKFTVPLQVVQFWPLRLSLFPHGLGSSVQEADVHFFCLCGGTRKASGLLFSIAKMAWISGAGDFLNNHGMKQRNLCLRAPCVLAPPAVD